MFGFFKKDKIEKRSSGSGFTADVMAARESWISGRAGIGELTATVQTCISMWEGAFALADVQGTDLLTRRFMTLAARSLAFRGEALFLIRETGLVPCSDWDLRTRDGVATAYRVTIPESGGARTETALAGEVLHFRIGGDMTTPYAGTAPLRRAPLTAGLLNAVETALAEVFEFAPLGSQIVPFPESNEATLEALGRGFRGRRGRVLLRESVNVSAAGGPTPQADWRPVDVTPNLQGAMTVETLAAARGAICGAFGVLPAMLTDNAQGPLVREAQRHLAMWTLQPIAVLIAEEISAKIGEDVSIDTLRPIQAYDVSGRARALSTIIEAMARAKEAQLSPAQVNEAQTLVNWGEDDRAS